MRILILDDDETLRGAVSTMLTLHGHEVETTEDAETAARMVEEGGYDFVLADYKMPDKDGIWFMQNAKVPRDTKVLLITAYANRQVINRMFELGASGYIIKPFDETELLRNLDFHSQ
jgi:DNA-binding response OmpR family regulator